MAMRLDIDMIYWATEQAETFLRPLGNRWDHTKGVVRVARQMAKVIDEENRSLLVTAAYLHDIGYAPILRKTGFHPLDGAIYIRSLGEVSDEDLKRFAEQLAQIATWHRTMKAFGRNREA